MTASDIRTYHISPWRRGLLGCIVGPIILALLIGGGLFFDSPDGKAMLVTALLIILIMLPFQLILNWTRLELSEKSVRLRQVGYTLETPWSNVAEIRLGRGREGFVTSEPIPGKGAARLARFSGLRVRGGARLYDEEQRALLAEHRLIPIEAFAWHLRRGTLRTDIARCGPRLRKYLDMLDKKGQAS